MATPENTGLPRREARPGGALDAEIQQQVADLNLRGIEVLRQRLAALHEAAGAGGVAADGGPVGPDGAGAGQPAARRRRGGALAGGGEGSSGARAGIGAAGPSGRRTLARLAGASSGGRPGLARDGLARESPGLALRLATPGDGALPAALQRLSPDWLGLDETALQRVAACPYLLFELDVAGLLGAVTATPRSVQESRDAAAAPAIVTPFGAAEGRRFARLLFHYAWYLVRSAPACAAFALGVPAASLEPLRALGLARVEELAGSARHWVRLRWDDDPLFWGDWLEAARRGEPAVLWASQLRGLQRIAGACRDMPASG